MAAIVVLEGAVKVNQDDGNITGKDSLVWYGEIRATLLTHLGRHYCSAVPIMCACL